MDYKKAGASLLWRLLIIVVLVLFVLFFPKTCGKTDFVSTVTEYSCQGISAPFIPVLGNTP
jgi:hypothetical protein